MKKNTETNLLPKSLLLSKRIFDKMNAEAAADTEWMKLPNKVDFTKSPYLQTSYYDSIPIKPIWRI